MSVLSPMIFYINYSKFDVHDSHKVTFNKAQGIPESHSFSLN